MWIASFPMYRSCERRTVLPSMATTSPCRTSLTASTHSVKQRSNCSASSMAKTLPKVSCEGMPLGNSSILRSHPSLRTPNASMSTQLSAPAMAPQSAMVRISISLWRLVRSIRGSTRLPKCSVSDAVSLLAMGHPPSEIDPKSIPRLGLHLDAIALYKVLDAKSQNDIERRMNELGKEGYRLASFNVTVPYGRAFNGNAYRAVMEREIRAPTA